MLVRTEDPRFTRLWRRRRRPGIQGFKDSSVVKALKLLSVHSTHATLMAGKP